ncbi:MAG: Ig-like domain-containing protein [Clostridiales Family XIII bacterium]|jgi:hypothetical protein|nr:Ig-like domain-containing protein [Clostridiales Family XIII bacterium]
MKTKKIDWKRRTRTLIVLLSVCVSISGSAWANGPADFGARTYPAILPETPPPEEDPEAPEDPPAPLPPIELTIADAPDTMKVGDNVTLSCTLINAEAGAVIEWRSSNDAVATVDAGGRVHASSPGSVEITASLGDARSSKLISVVEIAAESIEIAVREYSSSDMLSARHELTVDDRLHLTAKILPENAVAGEVQWAVDGEGVVTLDKEGLLTAVAEGEATITATAVGNLSDSIAFVVKKPETSNDLAPILLIVFIVIIVAIAVLVVILLVLRRRRREEAERRARAAAKKKELAQREKMKRDEADRIKEKAYAQGYIDSERETTDRMTRVFNSDFANREDTARGDEPDQPYDVDDLPDDDPDSPFSIDDIE